MSYTICFFFAILAEAVIVWMYSSSVFDARKSFATRVSVITVFYFTLFLVSLAESSLFNVISYILLNFVFFVSMFYIKWIFAFFHSVLITALMSTCEVITYGIIKLSSPNFLEHGSDPYSMMLFTVINKLIFLIIVFIISYMMGRLLKNKEHKDTSVVAYLFIPLTSVSATLVLTSISESYDFPTSINNMLVITTSLLLVSNLLVFVINQKNQHKYAELTNLKLSLQKETLLADYYNTLRSRDEDRSILIHDIKNHLNSISILNSSGQQQKISSYIDTILQSSSLRSAPMVCDNNLLNSIIYKYKTDADASGIDFKVDIRKNTIDFVSDNDITIIFCNLLDNAVEAAKQCSEPFIDLALTIKEDTDITVITLINSSNINPLPDKGSLPASTKSDSEKHGFGLKSIQKSIANYSGDMHMFYEGENSSFHTVVTLRRISNS